MMTLIGFAISVAYSYSAATVFGLKGMDFYWELATLILIMLLGHWIEMKAEGATPQKWLWNAHYPIRVLEDGSSTISSTYAVSLVLPPDRYTFTKFLSLCIYWLASNSSLKK